MATIDQLLNDIDEFDGWPFDIESSAADTSTGSPEEERNAATDLVDIVLRCQSR